MFALSLPSCVGVLVQVRDWIVPVNRRYPLSQLMAVLRKHFPVRDDGSHDRRHVLIEYIMLRGVNDSLDDARRLLGLLDGIGAEGRLVATAMASLRASLVLIQPGNDRT
jgi:adenine C2-methylase RlmN of 23S rRNA A2503 and tRNA A37